MRNISPLPEASAQTVSPAERDFSRFKPVSDDVFHAYELLYAYPKIIFNAKVEGVMEETDDWREEKVTFDAAYNMEGGWRLIYFCLRRYGRRIRRVLCFPAPGFCFYRRIARTAAELAIGEFFDYIVQSGRAVMYPIYEDTYERRNRHSLPGGLLAFDITTDWYKDAARSLDYRCHAPRHRSSKLAYLGVSMGSANG